MRSLLVIGVALVLMFAVQLLLGWLGSRRRLHVGRVDGVAVIRIARGRNAVLGATALAPTALLAVLPFATHERPVGLAIGIAATLAGLAVSGYFFAAEMRKRIRVDDVGIVRVGVFTARRVPWHDVKKIAYNPAGRWFFVSGRDGTRIWIDESFDGVGDFAEAALRGIPAPVLAAGGDVREELEELAAA